MSKDSHHTSTNKAWREATTLIGHNVLND